MDTFNGYNTILSFREWSEPADLNNCIQDCSKPLQNQQNFAVALYTQFSDKVQTEMEAKCLTKKDATATEDCVRLVKKTMKDVEFPLMKMNFINYLDFHCQKI